MACTTADSTRSTRRLSEQGGAQHLSQMLIIALAWLPAALLRGCSSLRGGRPMLCTADDNGDARRLYGTSLAVPSVLHAVPPCNSLPDLF